ncbi:MAG: hypothetical protein HY840_02935 [Bacteroidetes bacterium]|nr:hypothetical protein [Bacteroidota bacterium]
MPIFAIENFLIIMPKKLPFLIIFSLIIFLVFSCGNGKNNKDVTTTHGTSSASTNDTRKIDGLTQSKYNKLISNIPIPFDILRTHAEVPLIYNASVLNPTSNLPFYSSNLSKALNLGIYGGDLAYSITYEKFDDMGSYLKCAKKLADDLGIPLAFDQHALSTYKEFGTNKDSLERIIFSSYSEVDKTLKSNERIGLASLVVSGGWLEGLYTTLKTFESTPQKDKSKTLRNKIVEQKTHLYMILNLLGQFKDDQTYSPILEEFSSIKAIYDGLSVKSEINETAISALTKKVEEVRGKIVAR